MDMIGTKWPVRYVASLPIVLLIVKYLIVEYHTSYTLYNISNGATLCRRCHHPIYRIYGYRVAEQLYYCYVI